MSKKKIKIAPLIVGIVLSVLLIGVNVATTIFEGAITLALSTVDLDSAARASGEALSRQIEEEGIVMVKNDDNTLPLDVDAVNVFGWSSTQWIMGGSGSGRSVGKNMNNFTPEVDLLKALTEAGIEYNRELTNMYKSYLGERPFWSTGALYTHEYEFSRLYEPSVNDARYYSEDFKSMCWDYSDTALVVLGRVCGESNDCPTVQYKNYTSSGKVPASNTDTSRTYLDISTEEEELLTYVGQNYDNVVVIINSTNAMNLGFLDKIAGLDACLIVGGTGNTAARAIPDVLLGYKVSQDEEGNYIRTPVSPSGKTVATYAYDFTTNAGYANTAMAGTSTYLGTGTIYPMTTTSPNVGNQDNKYPGVSYLDYAEGIYVGYKWYETADAEGFWSSSFARDKWNVNGYSDVVQYPFGYGLSYTEFEWKVRSSSVAQNSALTKNGTVTIEVEVVNVGEYPGQDVVEVYYTPPYKKGGVEKSAINLAAYKKTQVIPAGGSEVVTLSFKVSDMASYDCDEKVVTGGGYILEKGNYQIKLMTDAHTLANVTYGSNTITCNVPADIIYYDDPVSGEEVKNLFGADSADGFAVDGSDSGNNITYMSRNNFAGTFPQKTAQRTMSAELKNKVLYKQADANAWEAAHNAATEPVTGADNGLLLYENNKVTELGVELGNPDNYDAEVWEDILDQLTLSEMQNIVLHGYLNETGANNVRNLSFGNAPNKSVDGPAQVGSFNQANFGTGFPNPTVLAQTWNDELAKSMGLAAGNEAKGMGYTGWYSPGVNLHRSAFGGRNYEYYSEDAYLTGKMAASVVQGSLNAGTYCFAKHIIGYDQESWRDALYCWMTEQALRELYLKPFKMAIDEGGLTGLMTSYGRIGAVWSGGSEALLTDLVRTEWGFKGAILTDYADHQEFMNGDQMIRNGGDIWMDGFTNNGQFKFGSSSAAVKTNMRYAVKHILYMRLNAEYVSSEYDPGADGIKVVRGGKDGSFWKTYLYVGDAVLGVIAVGLIALAFIQFPKKEKNAPIES